MEKKLGNRWKNGREKKYICGKEKMQRGGKIKCRKKKKTVRNKTKKKELNEKKRRLKFIYKAKNEVEKKVTIKMIK